MGPKGDFGVMGHHATVFGDQPKEDVQVANMITDMMMKDLSNEENRDFLFGLVHHAIRGVAGVAHHAIGAVGGVAHHLLGDEDKEDSIFGLIHHGTKGVDLHAFGAHHLLGDEDDFNPWNPSDEQ